MIQMSVSTALNLLICAHNLASYVHKQDVKNRRRKKCWKSLSEFSENIWIIDKIHWIETSSKLKWDKLWKLCKYSVALNVIIAKYEMFFTRKSSSDKRLWRETFSFFLFFILFRCVAGEWRKKNYAMKFEKIENLYYSFFDSAYSQLYKLTQFNDSQKLRKNILFIFEKS